MIKFIKSFSEIYILKLKKLKIEHVGAKTEVAK